MSTHLHDNGYNHTSDAITNSQNWGETITTQAILTYIPPLLVIMGCVGSGIIIRVLGNLRFKGSTVFLYLRLFSVSNIIVLVLISGYEWLCFVSGIQYVSDTSDVVCRLWMFLIHVCNHFPIWLIVSMILDRYVTVWHWERSRYVCTVFKAKCGLIFMMVVLVMISVHAMWTYELDPEYGCIVPAKDNFQHFLWPWISDSIYYFIPMIIILIFSFATLVGLYVRGIAENPTCSNRPSNKESTCLGLALALICCLLTLPTSTLKIVEYNIPTEMLKNIAWLENLKLARCICRTLSIANHAITIFLTLLLSPSFRAELGYSCTCMPGTPSLHREKQPLANFDSNSGSSIETSRNHTRIVEITSI